MKKYLVILTLMSVGLHAKSAKAVLGTADVTPAATILVPYFEVDLGSATGMKTIIGLQNASAAPVVTTVTVWSDLGVPVLNFNLAIPANGDQAFSMRDVLSGTLPQTTSAAAGCSGLLPPANLSSGAASGVQQALTGVASSSFSQQCAGVAHGDNIARGYVTIDVVNSCSSSNPTTLGYFATNASRVASDNNALLGDYFFINPDAGLTEGDTAVHIEADPHAIGYSDSGAYTFYGSLLGWNAADHREGLATTWSAAYEDSDTDLIVWRDTQGSRAPFACGAPLSFYPLSEQQLVVFDMQEQPVIPQGVPFAPQPPSLGLFALGAASGRYHVGGADGIPVVAREGWIFMQLSGGSSGPPSNPSLRESFVSEIHYPSGLPGDVPYGTGASATALDNVVSPWTSSL